MHHLAVRLFICFAVVLGSSGPFAFAQASGSDCSGCQQRIFGAEFEWGTGPFQLVTTWGDPPTAGSADLTVVVTQVSGTFSTNCGDADEDMPCTETHCETAFLIELSSDDVVGSAGDFPLGITDEGHNYLDHGDDADTANDFMTDSEMESITLDFDELVVARCGGEGKLTFYIEVWPGTYKSPTLSNLHEATLFGGRSWPAEFTVTLGCLACVD